MKRCFTFIAAATAVFGNACVNDRDSLAYEARRFPGILETVAGRFERNPAAYYQMRIDRIDRQGGPKTLGEYDDQGAAYDRIGKDDRAIAIMKKKAALMTSIGDRATKLDWYRYHANIGTFQVHRWFHDGADTKRIGEVKEAASHIKKSIELNPEAHFGREIVQLQVMEWIIATKSKQTDSTLGEWMVTDSLENHGDQKKIVEGLMGLMVLGAAWESVDVLEALGRMTTPDIGYFITLRIQELEKAGKKSATGKSMSVYPDKDNNHMAYYARLRKNAEDFDDVRKKFMAAQFARGKHPDTDADFWAGYAEVPPPKPLAIGKPRRLLPQQQAFLGVAAFLILGAIGYYVWDRVRILRSAA